MWEESEEILEEIEVPAAGWVVDVGCGRGSFTRVLRGCAGTTDGVRVIGVDADPQHLPTVSDSAGSSGMQAAATALPFRTDAVGVVGCQALLVNLQDPLAALTEFARVAADLVIAVEPNNAHARVTSSVPSEADLAGMVRDRWIAGTQTDPTLGGAQTERLFREAGLRDVRSRRFTVTHATEPPYTPGEVRATHRKATGAGLHAHRDTLLAGGLTSAEYTKLSGRWRRMGHAAARQLTNHTYHRTDTTPFYLTTGHPPTR